MINKFWLKQNNKNLDNINYSLSPFTFMSGVSGHRKKGLPIGQERGKRMLKRPKAHKKKMYLLYHFT